MSGKIRCVLFDLGNVLIKIDFGLCYAAWARKTGLTDAQVRARFSFDDAYARHERGEISGEQYHAHIRQILGVELSYPDFLEGWNAIFEYAIPETVSFLEEHAGKLKLCALSNTNPLHHRAWSMQFEKPLKLFDRVYVSSEIGVRKPEPLAYQKVLQDLGLEPEQVLFVDDLAENVRGAQAAGLPTVLFSEPQSGIREIKRRLLG